MFCNLDSWSMSICLVLHLGQDNEPSESDSVFYSPTAFLLVLSGECSKRRGQIQKETKQTNQLENENRTLFFYQCFALFPLALSKSYV